MKNIKCFSKGKNKNRQPKQESSNNLRVADIFWQKGLVALMSKQLVTEKAGTQRNKKIKNEKE